MLLMISNPRCSVFTQHIIRDVDTFQTLLFQFDHLDAHVYKLMDSSDVQKVHMVRKPMAGLLSMLLVLLAFMFKVVSIIR